MKLFGSLTSPYVRKVRIVMAEKKLDYEFILEDVWVPGTQIVNFNPLGKIPCLVTEDGAPLFSSAVIVEYLDTLTPVGKLIPANGRERAEVKRWEALADGVVEASVLIRLENTMRPEEWRSQPWITRQRQKIDLGLSMMSEQLGANLYCYKHYSLADVAVGCALGWLSLRFPDIVLHEIYPNLADLFGRLSERASFKDTVPQ